MNSAKTTAAEAEKALDALTALSVRLTCHCDTQPDTLILSARKVQEVCQEIDGAVLALRRILGIAIEAGGGPPASSS